MKDKVSERALIQRINRRIADECLKLHKARPADDAWLGHYYLVDATSPNADSFGNRKARFSDSGVTGCWIDLEQYGRDVGALAEGESVAAN